MKQKSKIQTAGIHDPSSPRRIAQARFIFSLLSIAHPLIGAHAAEPTLPIGQKVLVSVKPAHFDYMEVDSTHDRLLAAHAGNGNLVILDLKSNQLLAPIAVGNVHGVAIDPRSGTYILGDGEEQKVVFVNSKTLSIVGELRLPGPVDAIAVNTKTGTAYACEDDGNRLWVIDIAGRKLTATIKLPGVPEFVAFDENTNRVYQNIKDKNTVVVINAKTNRIESEWSTLPVEAPHGLAIDSQSGQIFVAGKNGKLVSINSKTGKVTAQSEIKKGTDQITFDAIQKTIYCASKGFISVVHELATGLSTSIDIPDHIGSHTVAVDPARHEAWVSYADETSSYLESFKTTKN